MSTNELEKHKQLKYVDLFCGLGAFHTAFNNINLSRSKVKYTCVLACDINDNVRRVYEENYKIKPRALPLSSPGAFSPEIHNCKGIVE